MRLLFAHSNENCGSSESKEAMLQLLQLFHFFQHMCILYKLCSFYSFYHAQNKHLKCSCLLISVNVCSHHFVFVLCWNVDVHNLPLHRQSVLNVQQDFTVLAQLMQTLGMGLGQTVPCCVLKDTIAHQVGYKSVYLTYSWQTNYFITSCYQLSKWCYMLCHIHK